jgi:hypothetical protein
MRYINIKQNKTNHFTLGAIDNLMTKDSSILFTCNSRHSPASRRQRAILRLMPASNRHNTPCNALHPAGDRSIEPEKPYYVKREAFPCVRNPRIDWQKAVQPSSPCNTRIVSTRLSKHQDSAASLMPLRRKTAIAAYGVIKYYHIHSIVLIPGQGGTRLLIAGVSERSFLIVRMPGVHRRSV